MTAAQLSLSRPGYCARCGVVRLSVVNLDGICDFCHDDLAALGKPRGGKCGVYCRCGQPSAYKSRKECKACMNARIRAWRASKREAARPVGRPRRAAARPTPAAGDAR